LLAGGVINYASVELPSLEVDAVVQSLRRALQSSSIMPAGYDLEQVATIGIVIQAPDDILSRTPFSFFDRLNEQVKEATSGAACYLGVYRNRSKNSRAALHLVCSSQQLPTGILAMVNDARREGGVLRDKLQQTLAPLDVTELEQFDLFRTNVRTGPLHRPRRSRGAWTDMSDDGFDAPSSAISHAPRSSAVPKSSISLTPTAPSVAPRSSHSQLRPTESDSPDELKTDAG
jgi:hypothetical protein